MRSAGDDPLHRAWDGARQRVGVRPADEIVLCTHSSGSRNWQEEGVVDEARERFGRPVIHLVVD